MERGRWNVEDGGEEGGEWMMEGKRWRVKVETGREEDEGGGWRTEDGRRSVEAGGVEGHCLLSEKRYSKFRWFLRKD